MIAHIERFIHFQKHTDNMERLWSMGMLIQSNASFFTSWKTKRTSLKLLKEGKIDLLGSDSHRAEGERVPDIADALAVIEKKLGQGTVERIMENGYRIIR